MNWRTKTKTAIKQKGTKLLHGDYRITHKLNRVGRAAHNVTSNIVDDFTDNGSLSFNIPDADRDFPTIKADAPVLGMFTTSNQPARPRRRKPRQTRYRRPRKVVYY